MNVCSQCLCAMRRQARADVLKLSSTQQTYRFLSHTAYRTQQSQANPRQASPQPPPIPTTTPTITSNVTAQQSSPDKASPSSSPSKPPPIPPSTADIQRHLQRTLTRSSPLSKLATSLRNTAKSTTQTYITYGQTTTLFKSCSSRAPYTIPQAQRSGIYAGEGPPKTAHGEDLGIPDLPATHKGPNFWFDTLGLQPTFSTWSQVTYLHMYILTVVLRTLPTQKEFLEFQRYLSEHFSNAAEDKMALLHGMHAKGVRNRYLKDLFMRWRGVVFAYDEGLVKGDAELGAAVWRNLWRAEEDVDWVKVAAVVGYMRRCIRGLEDVNPHEIALGLDQDGDRFWTSMTNGLATVVEAKTKGLSEPL